MKKLSAILLSSVCLPFSAQASTRHLEYIHNYLAVPIKIGHGPACTYKDVNNFDFGSNRTPLDDIQPNTSGYTWGDSESDMPDFSVNHSGSGSKEIVCPVSIAMGDKVDYKRFQFGKIAFDMIDGDHLDVGYANKDDSLGFYLADEKKMSGGHNNGHFLINKVNAEVYHFYVCVYEPNGSMGDENYSVTVNSSSGFSDKFTREEYTPIIKSNQTVSNFVHFYAGDSKTIACTPTLGSFATGSDAYNGNVKLTVTIKDLLDGSAYAVDVGELKMASPPSDGTPRDGSVNYVDTGTPKFGVISSESDPTEWTISGYNAGMSNQSSIDCPSGFCPSGSPMGDNDIYLMFERPGS
ncbi:hypothetical protein [Facilibium subflavum]|uniref:hypothetical protein n=1 Tax=Facilibium subflavum TaxID=2219058 RepID=UPI000E64616D|nr:hypothetical protein [Facilibium subflavum]